MSEQGTSVHPWPNGYDMLNAHDLANARGVQIEAQAKRIAELEAAARQICREDEAIREALVRDLRDERAMREMADVVLTSTATHIAELEAELAEERAAHEETKAQLNAESQLGALRRDELEAVKAELEQKRQDITAACDDLQAASQKILTWSALADKSYQCYEETKEQLKGAMAEVDFLHDEIVHITDDASATKARLRMAESAHAQLVEHLREIDEILGLYPSEGAPTYAADRLRWVLANLQKGKGGAA
jgi:chromosome segregation ATPase